MNFTLYYISFIRAHFTRRMETNRPVSSRLLIASVEVVERLRSPAVGTRPAGAEHDQKG